eukprot:g2679.t1
MASKQVDGGSSSEEDKPAFEFRSPHRVIVEEPSHLPGGGKASKDQGAAEMHPNTIKAIPGTIFEGDLVVIKGKTQSKLVLRLFKNPNCEEGALYVNDVARRNLRVKLSDMVSVHALDTTNKTPVIQQLELAPVKETIDGLGGNISKLFLYNSELYDAQTGSPLPDKNGSFADPPFLHAHRKNPWDTTSSPYSSWPRVLTVGQLVYVPRLMRDVWFKVVKMKTSGDAPDAVGDLAGGGGGPGGPPAGLMARVSNAARALVGKRKKKQVEQFGIVRMEDGTTVLSLADPVDESKLQVTGYADIGGLGKQIFQIREMVELPLRHPKLFKTIGAKPPKGVLMHGPPGCGKTLIARAISHETGAEFCLINGPEIMSGQRGGAEKNLRDMFQYAEEKAKESGNGAIIFIDEIDSIAPNRDKVKDEVLRRVVATLLTLMDGLNSSANMMVIGATNRPNKIDPALRRSGRFDAEICIPVPSTEGRREILKIVTKKQKMAEDVDLDKIAEMTHGYVGADLAAVAMKAATACIRRCAGNIVDMEAKDVPAEFLESLEVTMADYTNAVKNTGSSTIRDVVMSKPNVSFKDIGGLDDVKKELQEMINFPSQYEELFTDVGVRPPTGALMYGPPGCGKTLLAKAMAAECDANFISIKGPQLLTKWFGESEENVRGIFEKARQSAPCVLFFDELDSIAVKRGGFSGDHGVSNRIVNQLLTEMDGIGKRKNVFVIGATNRPDTLDPAILRPGRLDQKIYIPMPDKMARLSILRAQLRKTKVDYVEREGDGEEGAAEKTGRTIVPRPAQKMQGVDLEWYAENTNGYSGSDIAGMIKMAVKISVRKRIAQVEAKKFSLLEKMRADGVTEDEKAAMAEAKKQMLQMGDWKLTKDDFDRAHKVQRKSISPADLAGYKRYAENLQSKKQASSQLTTGDCKIDNMFLCDAGTTNEHDFDDLPKL